MNRTRTVALVVALGLATALLACEAEEEGVCTRRETQACQCAGGAQGEQVCSSAGTWAPCNCGGNVTPPQCTPTSFEECYCGALYGTRTCNLGGQWSSCQCEVNPDIVDHDVVGPDLVDRDVPDHDWMTPDVPPDGTLFLDYLFVRIDDLSETSGTPDGGADIDAVTLEKANGSVAYASSVEYYEHGGGFGEWVDPLAVVGAPDAFYNYPDVSYCDVSGGRSASLGGLGGMLIVRMSSAIEAGDVLSVLEVGGCEFDGGIAIVDPIDVFVSVASDPWGQWVSLGDGGGPVIDFWIANLPQVPAGW